MTFLRNLVSDLVEKRLWPFAVALLLALVAVPVVLGGGGSSNPAAPAPAIPVAGAAAAPGTDAGGTAQVSLETAPANPKPRYRAGTERNPFVQQRQLKVGASGSGTTAPTGSPASTGATGSAPTTSVTSPSTSTITRTGSSSPSTPVSTAPRIVRVVRPLAPVARRVYRVGLRFGTPAHTHSLHDLARLSALPSAKTPVLLFLGVRQDAKTAVFLVAPHVKLSGDGYCRPSRSNCRTLEMRVRDTEVLQAGAVGYQFQLKSVRHRTVKTNKAALRRHARTSKSGSKLYRTAAAKHLAGTRSFAYSLRRGVLLPR